MINEAREQQRFTAIFMAGGPGSGKSYLAKILAGQLDMNITDLDKSLRLVMSKVLGKDKITSPEFTKDVIQKMMSSEQAETYYDMARHYHGKRLSSHAKQGNNIIIDSTGAYPHSIQKINNSISELGYESYMVMVYTPLSLSLKRNKLRTRSLSDDYVKETHAKVYDNIIEYMKLFGDKFILYSPYSSIEEVADELNISPAILSSYTQTEERRLIGKLRREIVQQPISKPSPEKYAQAAQKVAQVKWPQARDKATLDRLKTLPRGSITGRLGSMMESVLHNLSDLYPSEVLYYINEHCKKFTTNIEETGLFLCGKLDYKLDVLIGNSYLADSEKHEYEFTEILESNNFKATPDNSILVRSCKINEVTDYIIFPIDNEFNITWAENLTDLTKNSSSKISLEHFFDLASFKEGNLTEAMRYHNDILLHGNFLAIDAKKWKDIISKYITKQE